MANPEDYSLIDNDWTFSGGAWLEPSPPPLPAGVVATFNADTDTADLTTQSNGIVTFVGGTREREIVPGGGGDAGYRFRHDPVPNPDDNGNDNEKRLMLSTGLEHFWDTRRIFQPANYTNRYAVALFAVEPFSNFSDWLPGDILTTPNGTAVLHSLEEQSGEAKIYVTDLSVSRDVQYPNGVTVTNQSARANTTFTLDRDVLQANNKKLFSYWINDGVNGFKDGYSQSGLFIEYNTDFDDGGNSFCKLQRNASAASGEATIFVPNELTNPEPLFDVADNGSWITLIFEFKRSANANDPTGQVNGYKLTERAGSNTETLTHIFQATGLQAYHSEEFNGFNFAYLFGPANGGFDEQTDYHLNSYELSTTKPQALIDAGF